MLRSFPTRFPNSLTGVVLLVPCLLICLSCATPFPIENLEEDMTIETVRENFGAPVRVMESSWTYLHEELEPAPLLVGPMPLRVAVASIWGVPFFWVFALADVFTDEFYWDVMYVTRAPVVLYFEDERLARWEVLPDIRDSFSTGSGYQNPFPSTMTWSPSKDAAHHAKGHKHHHGHGC